MIFRPELVKLILQGRKTMTRRPVKPGEKDCRYHENRVYSIQPGRGKHGLGRLTVTEVRRERLADLSMKDARREGFRTPQEFVVYWTELHGSYDPDLEVWVIGFLKGDHSQAPDRYLAAAPSTQHCMAVLSTEILLSGRKKVRRCGRAFQDGERACSCGARRPDEKLDDHGYTTLPHKGLKGEMAAIPEDLQERYSKEGRKRHEARKQRDLNRRRRLTPAERLARVEAESVRVGVDISSETRLIEQRAGRAERRIGADGLPDVSIAPRETDCDHGCCKAGDEYLRSEVVAVPSDG